MTTEIKQQDLESLTKEFGDIYKNLPEEDKIPFLKELTEIAKLENQYLKKVEQSIFDTIEMIKIKDSITPDCDIR